MGQRLAKGESLYNAKLPARAKEIILEIQPIKTDGSLHYAKIARILDIPSRTFSAWRDATSKEYYKPELVEALAEAHEELTESIESGKIKRAMIIRAQPYTRVKKFKELQKRGPKIPAISKMKKVKLLQCLKKLGEKVRGKLTNPILRLKIIEAVEKQTKEMLVTVKQEEERMHGDVTAAKLVLANIGPKNKRWKDKQVVDVEAGSLVDIIAKTKILKSKK